MQIYLVQRQDSHLADYDEYNGFVIVSHSSKGARYQAHEKSTDGEQRAEVWLDVNKSFCELLSREPIERRSKKAHIILSDFKAG